MMKDGAHPGNNFTLPTGRSWSLNGEMDIKHRHDKMYFQTNLSSKLGKQLRY